MEKNKVSRLIQVCAQVTDKNSNGEYNNLLEVMVARGEEFTCCFCNYKNIE